MVMAYFVIYVGIGFVYPLGTGGDTLLARVLGSREDSMLKEDEDKKAA